MEVEVKRNRPNFMVIRKNGRPIGTIGVKQPGSDAMYHGNILGKVYDHLQHLQSIFRVDVPFAILTSYNEWRICWLDNEKSNDRASSDAIHLQPDPNRTPDKRMGSSKSSDSSPTPEHPATPKSNEHYWDPTEN